MMVARLCTCDQLCVHVECSTIGMATATHADLPLRSSTAGVCKGGARRQIRRSQWHGPGVCHSGY